MTGIIDRLEGGFAVVELPEGTVSIPLESAPEGLREGHVVELSENRIVSIDEEATARRAAALHRRSSRLKQRGTQ